MFAFLAKLLAGPLVGVIKDLVVSYQGRKVSEATIAADVEKAILGVLADVSKSQASVIETEARGEGWLQRNWRPIVALNFAFIVIFYGLLLPISVGWLGFPPVRVGDMLLEWIMNAVMFCLGGYIGGRSLEKIVTTIVKR